MNRRGFTFIELLTVLVIMGILSSIGVLKYINLRHHATAAGISGDIAAIRVAAYNYWADQETFPADAGPGVVPPEMLPYLRQSFRFTRSEYTLDWDNYGPSGGGAYQVGITITAPDPRLQQEIIRMFGTRQPFFQSGDALTYIIVGPNGQM